ncbi:hypothetical protein N0V88_006114 [Collariella sp. IMI 366227]|nr:hypothetical protein N0V88_006114 [Collariella sp. IMI 366227]
MLQRDVVQQCRETIADLKELAGVCGVIEGKWMLFPEPGEVNAVWGKVAHATARGVGVAAKVETRAENAWTELGIYSGNPWGIGASMYSSNEIFGQMKSAAKRA